MPFLILSILLLFREAGAYTTTQLLENRLDPQAKYRTIQTEHFFIHFPKPLSPVAEKIAVLSEKVYAKVTAKLFIASIDPTHIVIADRSDEATVFTMVYPQRQIYIDASLPQMAKGINDYADIHEWILIHEFTHIAQLEMRRGLYKPLGSIFGSWIRPHLTAPVWEKEGLAVYLESTLTAKGRGTGTEYPMMMRMAAKEGLLGDSDFARRDTIFTLDNKAWPWGTRPYLFGYYLMNTLAKRGPTVIPKVLRHQAGGLPYFLEGAIEESGLSGFDELWETTLKDIRTQATRELEKVNRTPLTPLQYLTNQGHYFYGLQISPNGEKLYVTRDHPDHENAILSFDLKGDTWSEPKEVTSRSTGYQVSVSKSNRFIAFDQTLRSNRYYEWSDLYIYDLKKQEVIRSSLNMRARDPDIHPDGVHLVYVVNENGKNRLVMNDTNLAAPVDVLGDVGYSRLSGPRFSPDGKKIVVSVHNDRNGGEDLWLVDLVNNRTLILLEDGAQNTSPSWSQKGDRILFSSNATGVSNIYSLDLSRKKIERLTNVEGGLFYPTMDSTGRWIYAASYRGMGYDVARFRAPTPEHPTRKPSASNPSATYPVRREPVAGAALSSRERAEYSGTGYLFPQFILPSFVFRPGDSQVGASIGAIDPLFFQNYSLNLRYAGKFKKPVGSFYYFNGTQRLAFDLTVSHDVTAVAGTSLPYETFSTELGVHIPIGDSGNHFYLHPYLVYQSNRLEESSKSAGFGSEIRYDTTFKQIGHSFPESGTRITLDDRQLYEVGGSKKRPNVLSASFTTHTALPWTRHALHFSLEGASYLSGGSVDDYFYTLGGMPSFPFNSSNNYTLYGARGDALRTTRLALGTLLYTFSLADIQRGLGISPVYLGRLSGALRFQGAGVPAGTLPTKDLPWSAGVELYQSIVFGTLFDITARAGVYRASSAIGGETQALFLLSSE